MFAVVEKHIIMISERRRRQYINHIIRYTKLETNKAKKNCRYGDTSTRKAIKEK